MFKYSSVQTHSVYKNGKRETKTNRVTIKGKSGYKMVTIRNKAGRKKSRKRLTQKEIKCIKSCQFVPGLFKDCQKCLK